MSAAELSVDRGSGDTLTVRLAGRWLLKEALPTPEEVERRLESDSGVRRLAFDSSGVTEWDSGLLSFLVQLSDYCRGKQIEADAGGLPEGARKLLDLASAVPEREGAARGAEEDPFLARVGKAALAAREEGLAQLTFLGEATRAFGRFLTGRANYRRSDFWLVVQDCGASALPIVTLISLLVGLILAFVGAQQLRMFGATIFVANLVGVGMARQMGAIMTAIIMAGRTGASFAAQLGTMTVNEEIDALRTLGVSPMEFLVLPRMLALMLMMPLLSIYSVLMGMIGGFFVAVTMLDISPSLYYQQTVGAIALRQFAIGILCATVFGALVALSGCLRGMQCGRSAQAVGAATTSAVVTGIVWIVVSDGILTVIFDVLGI